MGIDNRSYAEGIVKVCGFCLLAFVLFLVGAVPMAAGAASVLRTRQQDSSQAQRPGDGVTMPVVVYEVKPKYTPEAREAKIQGTVLLEAVVLETGAVGEVKIVRSLDSVYGLDDEAVKAMKQWRFKPGTKDGKPVAVRVEVEMSFTLK